MSRRLTPIVLSCCFVAASDLACLADREQEIDSKIVSVALFKNGLALVKRQVQLEGPGPFRISDVPEPVHGTFLVESNGSIEARVEPRVLAAKQVAPLGINLQEELAGLKVTIYPRTARSPIVGTVMSVPKSETEDAGFDFRTGAILAPGSTPPSRFLLMKTDKGISYVDMSEIASLEAEGKPSQASNHQTKAVLLLTPGANQIGKPAQISYLAHGLSWAPSYNISLIDEKRMSIEQQAVIRNELMDLEDTEVSLISGYPSVQFAHILSPLVPTQNWDRFFQQLSSRGNNNQAFSNSIVTQNMAYSMRGNDSGAGTSVAPNIGDTLDLNYFSIGKRSLKQGSSLGLATGKAQTSYERIVDWKIPDNRDEWGTPNNNRRTDPTTGEALQDDVWDALIFKNPLPFPMTSAPAMVTTAGNFSGQSQVLWTNKNEESTLRVNKALSIRARNVEYENQTSDTGNAERDMIYLGGRRFRKVTVNGELRLCNHRPADIKMSIKRQFSGDYVSGDGSPTVELREEGVWTVNKRNELTWNLSLKPSEERTIKYQYTLLVNF